VKPDDALVIEPLGRRHDRAAFSCGVQELDRYLKRQAGQDVRRRTARVFVCMAKSSNVVVGFYTLSALSLDLGSLPQHLARKLPRHPIPAALIGRLAVDRSTRGLGIGRMLLTDAFKRTPGHTAPHPASRPTERSRSARARSTTGCPKLRHCSRWGLKKLTAETQRRRRFLCFLCVSAVK